MVVLIINNPKWMFDNILLIALSFLKNTTKTVLATPCQKRHLSTATVFYPFDR